ncbi:MAG TPA: response regulator, partial [Longimicrobium sp.]|nr:response regulator [Longimicrobium sp.]
MSDTFAILLLEDDEAHAYVARHLLERHSGAGPTYRVTHVERMALAEAALAESVFDLILADLSVPDSRGVETIERLRRAAEGTPVVVLSALSDETAALEALRVGAQDYVIKEDLSRAVLLRAVRYAIERGRSREDAEVRGLLEATLDSLSAQVAVLDRGGRIMAANGAWRSFAAAAGVAG